MDDVAPSPQSTVYVVVGLSVGMNMDSFGLVVSQVVTKTPVSDLAAAALNTID